MSNRPDLGQFQCNGALAAAKELGRNPREIGRMVAGFLEEASEFEAVSLAGPGFINITLTDSFLADHVRSTALDARYGVPLLEAPVRVIVDYGGPNVAKPMHVGHLRAAIIGESIKRISRFLGNDTLGDVHLGDWGLQMGMLIAELEHRRGDLPYFDADFSGPYPLDPPVTVDELERLYPEANARAKADETVMEAARRATAELQSGRPGYVALWRHFVNVSIESLKADYHELNVDFDLWLGESDTQERIQPMIDRLVEEGYAFQSEGALVIDVTEPEDKRELPPLILRKGDGAVLYGTTDLATIEQRVTELEARLILYVVDKRQSDHFTQVFRAAHKTGIAPECVQLEHIGFGTMNGKDGKPFKTREGGVMRLRDLMQMVTDKARERMREAGVAEGYGEEETGSIARLVGMAALKFADLMNHRTRDYVFDLERFSSFEGRTGPYLLYTVVRTKSILRNARARKIEEGTPGPPTSAMERDLLLAISAFPDAVHLAYSQRAPNHISEYAYNLATAFNRFYREHHILNEPDTGRRASWLGLARLSAAVLEKALYLLGIEAPERM